MVILLPFRHFLPYAIPRAHDNNILHIAITVCLNDEKVGALKSLDGKMYRACIRFFFFFLRRIQTALCVLGGFQKGITAWSQQSGTTFYAITRLCFTAGGSHAFARDTSVCCDDVYCFITRHLSDEVVTDRPANNVVSLGNARTPFSNPIFHGTVRPIYTRKRRQCEGGGKKERTCIMESQEEAHESLFHIARVRELRVLLRRESQLDRRNYITARRGAPLA